MDGMAGVQRALNFIERNLAEDITLKDAAWEAGFSMYHFHRMFQSMVGDSVTEYIRKRRLTLAASQLLNTEKRIIDIAFDFHFESQEAFTRAFKKLFGITPGRYRSFIGPFAKKMVEPANIDEKSSVKGGNLMEPRIVEKGEIKVIGMTYFGENKNMEVTRLWDRFLPRLDEIKNRIGSCQSYGICSYTPATQEDFQFEYMACVETGGLESIPEGMVSKTLPANKYLVFTFRGNFYDGMKNKIQELYSYAYGTYMPEHGYEPAGPYDFEYYDERFTGTGSVNSEIDIYIPVK
jgi:AraC family transcriptional regulator